MVPGMLGELAETSGCARIDMLKSSMFARFWAYAIMSGSAFILAIVVPYYWSFRHRERVPHKSEAGTASKDVEITLQEDDMVAAESSAAAKSSEPDREAALRHLRRTSATIDDKWLNPLCWDTSKINQIGGTGTELYFTMLRDFGIVFAVMAALTTPLTAFSLLGNFAPDGGPLIRTTVGNLGRLESADVLSPILRVVEFRCQGITLMDLTPSFAWLDFVAVVIFLVLTAWFRFIKIPRLEAADSLREITPSDFAVEISHLPRRIDIAKDYETELRNHLIRRLKSTGFSRSGPDASEPEICELTLVRDYGGRLDELQLRAALRQSLEIAKAHQNFKKAAGIEKRLEKLEGQLTEFLDPKKLPVTGAFAILNSTSAVQSLLFDYRFSNYYVLRNFQSSSRQFRGNQIRIRRAPEPTDLIWENQSYSWCRRFCRRMIVRCIVIVVMFISIVLIYVLTAASTALSPSQLSYLGDSQCDPVGLTSPNASGDASNDFKCVTGVAQNWTRNVAVARGSDALNCWCATQGYQALVQNSTLRADCQPWLLGLVESAAVQSSISLATAVLNIILKHLLLALAAFEKPLTYTALNSSTMQKLFVAQLVNTGCIIFMVNAWGPKYLRDLSLVIPGIGNLLFRGPFDDITRGWYTVVGATLLLNMLLTSVLQGSTSVVSMMLLWVKRRMCAGRAKHQAELIQLYTNPEFPIDTKYAQLLTVVFVTMVYSAGLPLLNLFALLFMFVTFWTEKFILLWASKKPPNLKGTMAKNATELMFYAVGAHSAFAIVMYGQPCSFPSRQVGGFLADLAGQVSGYEPVPESLSRLTTESTWMMSLLAALLTVLWLLWICIWLLEITLGTACTVLCMACCPSRPKINPEGASIETGAGDLRNAAAHMPWVRASEHIQKTFPPASYALLQQPSMQPFANFLGPKAEASTKATATPPQQACTSPKPPVLPPEPLAPPEPEEGA